MVDRANFDVDKSAARQHDLMTSSVISVSILLARLGQATQIMPSGAIAVIKAGIRGAKSAGEVTKITTRSR